MSASLALVLAACGDGGDGVAEPPAVDEDPTEQPEAPSDEEPVEPDDGIEDEAVAEPDDDAADQPDDGTTEDPETSAARLDGTPSTETASEEGEPGMLAVTDVRVGTHDGFDRIVFELDGDDGLAGWSVRYEQEPTSQGSGEPIEVQGEAYLAIAIHDVALPPDLPDDIAPWEKGPLAGPEGGVVVEVVPDTIFEGIHTFVAGIDEELPFLVERFEDPQRVVIDVVHEG